MPRLLNIPRLLAFLAVFLLCTRGPAVSGREGSASGAASPYVGSERCTVCHQIQYKGWVKTFHSTVIQDVKKNPKAILADLSDPDLPFKKRTSTSRSAGTGTSGT